MTDTELEGLAHSTRWNRGWAPWASWESERTGFGRLFRRRALYPAVLPLMFSSDHYIDALVTLRENEVNHGQDFYATWNPDKARRLERSGVRVLHIRHPWMDLPGLKLNVPESSRGTLVFWPHGHPKIRVEVDRRAFFSKLETLPSHYRPFRICLSSHDIHNNVHCELRNFGYPLTTAGDLLDQRFPSRFIKILQPHRYSAGTNIGSHTFLSMYSGRPYRVVGRSLVQYWLITNTGELPYDMAAADYPEQGEREKHEALTQQLEESLQEVPRDLQEFTFRLMGSTSVTSRHEFSRRVWRAFFRQWRQVLSLYLQADKH